MANGKFVIGNVDLFPFVGTAAVTGNIELSGNLLAFQQTSTPSAPASGAAVLFYSASSVFARFPSGDTSNLVTAPGVTISNDANNRLTTAGGDSTLNGEANLTFDGSDLEITGTLNVSSVIHARGVPSGTVAGPGSYLALDANNKVVVTASSGGGTVTINNDGNNRVTTAGGDSSINGEANLTFDGNTLSVQGGIVHKRRSISSTTTASVSDYYVSINASGDIDIRLPDASTLTAGQTYVIKDEGGNAHLHNIAVSGSGSQTIDGLNFILLNSPFAAISLYSNGSDKFFIY